MNEFESATKCPFCGANHDRATGVSDANAPNDGDITLCVNCGEWAFFEGATAGGLRKPTDAEYELIAGEPLLRKTREVWAGMVEQVKRRSKP